MPFCRVTWEEGNAPWWEPNHWRILNRQDGNYRDYKQSKLQRPHLSLVISRQLHKHCRKVSVFSGILEDFIGEQQMDLIPLVRKVALAPAISYLSAEGVPVHRHLRRAKLSAPTPETLGTLIPLHQVCDFLNSVARAEGIHDLGFHIAGNLGMESMGSYGRQVAKAFTFHEAIQITRELISTYNSGLKIWIEHHGDRVRYCLKYVGNLPRDGITEIVHLALTNTFAVAGVYRGTDWKPSRIELATDPIDLAAYAPELDDLPISFNQPQTSLWFDRKWLSKPLPTFQSSQRPVVNDNERASLLATGPSIELVGQLGQVVESTLGHPEMNLQLTAAIIGTSPRTLQRRLAEHDTSFSRLLQTVRFRTARRFLRTPEMPLTEIAKRLGYTDPANFVRAFKRWTGIGPSEFRQLHYTDAHE